MTPVLWASQAVPEFPPIMSLVLLNYTSRMKENVLYKDLLTSSLSLQLKLRRQERTIREILPAASTFDPNAGLTEAGFDLIEGMLALDPKKRITAQEALRHRW